nr:hypothetical protein Iba_chr04cCG5900 [Ipomoea batatas]
MKESFFKENPNYALSIAMDLRIGQTRSRPDCSSELVTLLSFPVCQEGKIKPTPESVRRVDKQLESTYEQLSVEVQAYLDLARQLEMTFHVALKRKFGFEHSAKHASSNKIILRKAVCILLESSNSVALFRAQVHASKLPCGYWRQICI